MEYKTMYGFWDCHNILALTEEKLLWNFLSERNVKLKDIRFKLYGTPIGAAIYICDINGKDLLNITDYSLW